MKTTPLRKILGLCSLLTIAAATTVSYAAGTSNITTTATPANVLILSNGSGLVAGEYFGPLTVASFNGHSGNGIIDTLTSINYTVASYPGATADNPKLCYYAPYTATSTNCVNVAAGSSGTITTFNGMQFGPAAEVSITHSITGTPNASLKPSGQETVVFNYSY